MSGISPSAYPRTPRSTCLYGSGRESLIVWSLAGGPHYKVNYNPGLPLTWTERTGGAPLLAPFEKGPAEPWGFTCHPSAHSALDTLVSFREGGPDLLEFPNWGIRTVSCGRVPSIAGPARAGKDQGHRSRDSPGILRDQPTLSLRTSFSSQFSRLRSWRHRTPQAMAAERVNSAPRFPLPQLPRDHVPGRWPTTESCRAASLPPCPVPRLPASAWLFLPASFSGCPTRSAARRAAVRRPCARFSGPASVAPLAGSQLESNARPRTPAAQLTHRNIVLRRCKVPLPGAGSARGRNTVPCP